MSTGTLTGLIDELESVLDAFLTEETEKAETERDFLLAVLDGRTGGSDYNVEAVSTDTTAELLTTLLEEYIPVEED